MGRKIHPETLPDVITGPRIICGASAGTGFAIVMRPYIIQFCSVMGLIALVITVGLGVAGCAQRDRSSDRTAPSPARHVVVVAPVVNLSGTPDLDPLKLTDILASELLASSTVSVVPVNLTLAGLARRGKLWVETPADAIELARELGADATIVMAVTEFDPYDPPIVGLVLQWYEVPRREAPGGLDPVAASRSATSPRDVELSAAVELGPRYQIQRVFNAAEHDVLEDVRRFAAGRDDGQSPYGWRKYTKSQELYVRYCCWAIIRSMLTLDESQRAAATPNEVRS